jgi:hypothetical protein
VYTLGEFWVPEIYGGRLSDFSEGWVFRRWRRASSSVCARKAGVSVNGISRKQKRVRACSGRAGVNGRARKHAFVRLDRAPKHQRARARVGGWRGRECVRAGRQQQRVFRELPPSDPPGPPNTSAFSALRSSPAFLLLPQRAALPQFESCRRAIFEPCAAPAARLSPSSDPAGPPNTNTCNALRPSPAFSHHTTPLHRLRRSPRRTLPEI